MLLQVIDRYMKLFAQAGASRDTTRCSELVQEMRQEFTNNPPTTTEVLEGLALIDRSGGCPESEFILSAAWGNLSSQYTPLLCNILLNEQCKNFHEPVVELLQEVGDESAVPALTQALAYRWKYDQWLHVPRKALQALSAIGSPASLDIVRQAMYAPEEALREEASSLLEDEV